MIEKLIEKLKKDKSLVLQAKVHPGAKENRVKEIMDDGVIKIDIAAAPEKGKANKELVGFLAKEFKVSKSNIKILSGQTAKLKKVLIFKQ